MRIVNFILITISFALIFSSCSTTANIQVEKDPVFNASAASTITGIKVTSWDNATDTIKWAVYRKTETYNRTEIDLKISQVQGGNAYTKAESDVRYLRVETDPLFGISPAKTITLSDIQKWNLGGGTINAYTKEESIALFAPIGHLHAIAQVTNLQSSLDGKAPLSTTATKQQLTDSINKLNKTIDGLKKDVQDIKNFLYDTTHFGALINGDLDIAKKASIVKDSLKANYARYDLNINLWTGINKGIKTLNDKGIKVFLNINSNNIDAGIAFEKDTIKYKRIVTEIISTYYYALAGVAVDNEMYNPLFHPSFDINWYVKLFRIAADVCHKYGIKITDGGMYGNQVEALTYRFLVSQSRQSDADFYASQCRMFSSQIKDAQQVGRNAQMEIDINTLLIVLTAVKKSGDWCNFHVYTDTSKGTNKFLYPQLWFTAECFEYYTGKKTISNEWCQRNNSNPNIVTSMMQDFKYAGYEYAICFSGDGIGGAVTLIRADGSLKDNGKAFRDSKWNM